MTAGTLSIVKQIEGRLLGLDGHSDPAETNGEYAPFLTGFNFRGVSLFPVNAFESPGDNYREACAPFYATQLDDFLGPALPADLNAVKGSDASTAGAINIQPGGVARLTTGAGSTHTMAVNGSQLVGSKNWLVSNGDTVFEARVGKASAVTSQQYAIGLADVSTLSPLFTISGVTVTTALTNAVAFVQDPAATNASTFYAVSINAGGTAQIAACAAANPTGQTVTLGIDTAAQHKYRIEVDAAGNATFYIDGIQVAFLALAVATTATLAQSVGTFSEITSGSQTIDIDYIRMQQLAGRG